MDAATALSFDAAFPRDDRTTVAELVRRYQEDLPILHGDRARSTLSARERDRILALFVADHGPRAVSQLGRGDLVGWIAAHKAWQSPWTRKRVANTVQAAFNFGVEASLITRNPFKGLRLPKGQAGRDLVDAEFRALLRVSLPHFRRVLVFLRFSGARPGELRRLLFGHINLESGAAILRDHKTAHSTGKPRRIPLCGPLVKLLIWLRRRHPTGQEHVFLTVFGKPWKKRALCSALLRARRRAGLPDDVKLYGCRHAYATNAVLNGLDVATLAQLMGHSTTRTTEIYLHMAGKNDWLAAAAERAVKKQG